MNDEAKRVPKPEYSLCNAGHELEEIYNVRKNSYDWDCPICIEKMRRA